MKKSSPYSSPFLYPLETLPSFITFTSTAFGVASNYIFFCCRKWSFNLCFWWVFQSLFCIEFNLYIGDIKFAVDFLFSL